MNKEKFVKEEFSIDEVFNDLKNMDTFQIASLIIADAKERWDRNPELQFSRIITIGRRRYDCYEEFHLRKLSQRYRLFMSVEDVLNWKLRLSDATIYLYWKLLWSPIDSQTYRFGGFPDIPAMYDEVIRIKDAFSCEMHNMKSEYPRDRSIRDPKGKVFKVNPNFEYFLPYSEGLEESKPIVAGAYTPEISLRFLRDEINRLDMMSYMDTV